MVLQLLGHLPGKLAGLLVALQHSTFSTKTHEIQGESSRNLEVRDDRLAVRWSLLPGRDPQISAATSPGFPSFLDYGWTAKPNHPLHNVHPCASGHNTFVAVLLNFANLT